jgi:hypothetical protein
MRLLSKDPGSKFRSIAEVAVDRRATVDEIPALGDRGLPKLWRRSMTAGISNTFLFPSAVIDRRYSLPKLPD